MHKAMIVGAALATLLASPVFAQSYSKSYGTGNTIDLPLAERTNGAAGVGVGAYDGVASEFTHRRGYGAFAYAPRGYRASAHYRGRHWEHRR